MLAEARMININVLGQRKHALKMIMRASSL